LLGLGHAYSWQPYRRANIYINIPKWTKFTGQDTRIIESFLPTLGNGNKTNEESTKEPVVKSLIRHITGCECEVSLKNRNNQLDFVIKDLSN
jgi:hypothetical protein